jgi:uridine kinase
MQAPDVVEIVAMDDFYRPSSAERRLHEQVLLPLSRDEPARYQRYDWARDTLAEWASTGVGGIVVVEGVYVLGFELRDFFDFTIWVECPYDERIERIVERDGIEGLEQWLTEWIPNEQRYADAEHPVDNADLILDGSSREGVNPLREVVESGRRPTRRPRGVGLRQDQAALFER